ncbi:GntR family transcriptional regulator [Paenibacillus protaetiae]|uniref:GntR family transcriptional regulator n=2 Tax=Paenibacillus protaetiae TaxID=2509456 RepID=A0A4P6F144_9BACL|nr:GntR family transcriptional regulator [Paenibacillus protaetiae]
MIKQYPSSWLTGASLGEAVSSELRFQILRGTLPHGEVLSENRIASDFGISRSPVREALRTLAGEGLLELERMGAVVRGMDARDIQELYDVRYLIESFVQVQLAGKSNSELFVRLKHVIDRMELAAQHMDSEEFTLQDLNFHEAIISELKHNRIMHLWKSIRQLVLTVMLITTENVFNQGTERIVQVIDKHRRLLENLESGDESAIEESVRVYFADSRSTLHRSIR